MPGLVDETHDPARRSWVASANLPDADFPIQNLPLGMFSLSDNRKRFGIAIGDAVLDVSGVLDAGLLDGEAAIEAGGCGTLNGLFALGRPAVTALRRQVGVLLDAGTQQGLAAQKQADRILHRQADCRMHLPVAVGNYTDFFAGIHHARAAGALLMPENPLPVNYKWVPIAYHGRASSVRASGGEIRRPHGQRPRSDAAPSFGPCERLDLELEMGFYVGPGNELGAPIPIGEAADHIIGMCLLNDWSARDIQRWEMQPLGPFLSKSFSTTVSPWVVTMDALKPFRVAAFERPEGDPAPLDYLTDERDQSEGGLDIRLAVQLRTARMRQAGEPAIEIINSNSKYLYWTLAQMVAHHSSSGCNLLPGDLIGTGTISGPTREELSSLLELTMGGKEPVRLPNGEQRGFLADGDEITLTAKCCRNGFVSIGFGRAAGTIVA